MKIETYLNAMVKAELDRTDMRKRQIAAFRARILRMNAEKDDEIGEISHYFDYIFEQLEDCRKEIIEKDEEIRVLENLHNESMDNFDKLEDLLATKDTRIAELEDEVWHWEHGG